MRGERRPVLFWDLSSLAVGQLLSMLLGFVAFAYLARTLTPASYGLVEYAVGLAGVAAILIEAGLTPIGALGVSRDPARARDLAGRIVAARFFLALLIVPVVGLVTRGQEPKATALIWLFAFSLVALPLKQDWLLQGLERMKHVAAAQVLRSAVFAVGVVLVVHSPEDLLSVGLLECLAAFVTAGYYLIAQRALGVPLRAYFQVSQIWELIRAGASVGASNAVWPLMLYLPIFLVTNVAGTAEAAWLGAAQRIIVALVSFSGLYFFNLYPVMARGLNQDRATWEQLMASSFRVVAWTSVGIAMAATAIADWIVVLAFGPAFAVAAPVFSIYMWLLPLRLLSGHARWTLLAGEQQRFLLIAEILGLSALVGFGLVLIPKSGAVGAAVSMLASNVVCWACAHLFAERHVGRLPGFREALAPIGSALLTLALTRVITDDALVRFGLSIAMYGICLRLMGGDLIRDARRLAYAKRVRTA